jgi:cytochrome P450
VCYFPDWFPGTYYAKFARRMRPDVDNFNNYPFEDVLQQIVSILSYKTSDILAHFEKKRQGVAEKSFLSENIAELKEAGAQDKEIANELQMVAAVLFIGGADTSTGVMAVLLRELVRHPEILEKAHEEIDRVVGEDRLPAFEDRINLPYLECIVQETLRLALYTMF